MTVRWLDAWSPARVLRRWSLRHRQYRGGVAVLDALYEQADPWDLAAPQEQARFVATNALIAAHVPHCSSLLEVGCGEGLQSRHLLDVAERVTGIDGSATALARARRAAPNVTFMEGDFSRDLPQLATSRYALVTLCEVLYYIDDPQAALRRAQALADHVMVTIYEPQLPPLAALFTGAGWENLSMIAAGGRRWNVYLWRKPDTEKAIA